MDEYANMLSELVRCNSNYSNYNPSYENIIQKEEK
jgi:hypothetical protein